MDASHLLGALINSDYGRGRGQEDHRRHQRDDGGGIGIGTMAAGAVGVAAVGGLGYLAYKHFTGAQSAGQPGMMGGQPGMMGGQPGMMGGQPGMMGGQPGMMGGQPGMGGPAGMMGGIMGSSSSMRTDGFSVPGYEYQQGGGQAAPAPQAAPQQGYPPPPEQGYPPPPAYAPGPVVAVDAPPVNYGALPPQPPPYRPEGAPEPAPAAPHQAAPVAQPTGDQQRDALLLVRAMIAASFADGTLDEKERADILARIDRGGIGAAEREAFLKELDAPKPVMLLASQVKTPELAEQFYLVSGLSISPDSEAEKAHLQMLPGLLKLTPAQVAAIHQRAGWPPP